MLHPMVIRAKERYKARKGWRAQGWRNPDIILNKLVRKSLTKKVLFRRLEDVRRRITWKSPGRTFQGMGTAGAKRHGDHEKPQDLGICIRGVASQHRHQLLSQSIRLLRSVLSVIPQLHQLLQASGEQDCGEVWFVSISGNCVRCTCPPVFPFSPRKDNFSNESDEER